MLCTILAVLALTPVVPAAEDEEVRHRVKKSKGDYGSDDEANARKDAKHAKKAPVRSARHHAACCTGALMPPLLAGHHQGAYAAAAPRESAAPQKCPYRLR